MARPIKMKLTVKADSLDDLIEALKCATTTIQTSRMGSEFSNRFRRATPWTDDHAGWKWWSRFKVNQNA